MPHIGIYLQLDADERLGVTSASAEADGPKKGALEPDRDSLLLGTGDGGLRITAVKPAGKREMPTADYLRGNPSLRLAP
jgi:methionyl-tRNA formyltransferase